MLFFIILLLTTDAQFCMSGTNKCTYTHQSCGRPGRGCHTYYNTCTDRTCRTCNDVQARLDLMNYTLTLNDTLQSYNVSCDNVISLINDNYNYSYSSIYENQTIDIGGICTTTNVDKCTYNGNVCKFQNCIACKDKVMCKYVVANLNTINKTLHRCQTNVSTVYSIIEHTLAYCQKYSSSQITSPTIWLIMILSFVLYYFQQTA